jgi:hypothetical protein
MKGILWSPSYRSKITNLRWSRPIHKWIARGGRRINTLKNRTIFTRPKWRRDRSDKEVCTANPELNNLIFSNRKARLLIQGGSVPTSKNFKHRSWRRICWRTSSCCSKTTTYKLDVWQSGKIRILLLPFTLLLNVILKGWLSR